MWKFINQHISAHLSSTISDVTVNHISYSYGDIKNIVHTHGKLLKDNIKTGSKCAIICDSEFYSAISVLAAWYSDLIVIPLSRNYGDERCKEILKLCDPDLIIVDNNDVLSFCPGYCIYNIVFKEFINLKSEFVPDLTLSDVVLIMFTSGTTGIPKGIMLTKSNLINNVLAICDYFIISNYDSILIARPLCHSAVLTGEFLTSLVKGTNIVFDNTQYLPNRIFKHLYSYNITVLCGTPTMFRHLSIYCTGKTNHIIESIVISGENLSQNTSKLITACFPNSKIYNVYGLTEAAPRVSYLPPSKFNSYPESVGIPLKNTKIKIMSENNKSCKNYEYGEIYVKSDSIMKGYYKNEELTKKVIVDGWLKTGDIGYRDENGYLYITSRIDDMINKAGMNIYPSEIEKMILQLKEVERCLVFPYEFNDMCLIGADIVINNKNYPNVTEKQLKYLIAEKLPRYLIPNKIRIVNEIPQSISGKLKRSYKR